MENHKEKQDTNNHHVVISITLLIVLLILPFLVFKTPLRVVTSLDLGNERNLFYYHGINYGYDSEENVNSYIKYENLDDKKIKKKHHLLFTNQASEIEKISTNIITLSSSSLIEKEEKSYIETIPSSKEITLLNEFLSANNIDFVLFIDDNGRTLENVSLLTDASNNILTIQISNLVTDFDNLLKLTESLSFSAYIIMTKKGTYSRITEALSRSNNKKDVYTLAANAEVITGYSTKYIKLLNTNFMTLENLTSNSDVTSYILKSDLLSRFSDDNLSAFYEGYLSISLVTNMVKQGYEKTNIAKTLSETIIAFYNKSVLVSL